MKYGALYTGIQEIMYSGIVFIGVMMLIFTILHLLFKPNYKQTKFTELILTLITIVMFFGIPYLAINYSFTTTLITVCILGAFVSIILYFLSSDNNEIVN